ncbi:TPA: hypothetical protein J1184_004086, partial [Escherichia coli]|nr:hypothetical protein [Escherichia coli]HAZ3916419.1 hypothetical protein [Escherichia coli]HBA8669056.1 hypothetical protein [Escherichia coli]HBA8709524.1 hypothetical protein [Escherichia coli]
MKVTKSIIAILLSSLALFSGSSYASCTYHLTGNSETIDLSGCVATAENTASTASSTASNALTTAQKAQTTANTANTAAQSAQTTANEASSAAK